MPGTRTRSHSRSRTVATGSFDTPFGPVHVAASANGLVRIQIGGLALPRGEGGPDAARAEKHLDAAGRALARFAAGAGDAFADLPLDLTGTTEFQRTVYDALRRLPAGETMSYGALAAVAGRPGAARAVGRAMATNPLPLAIPCHRVLGADGGLHGYGAEGDGRHNLGLKQRLLDIERVNPSGGRRR